ncbi:recA-like protein [Sphingomicrobium sp. XHP0239]|uniref:ImuA family protein n=1 Tax=Sphingomicrobium maritimum TaxID=3133972 RepID=UPI0031CC4FD9
MDGAADDVVRPDEPSLPDGAGDVRAPAGDRLPAPPDPTLSECFSSHPRDAGWVRFLLSRLPRTGPILWVQERMAILEAGRIHPPGLEGPLGGKPGVDIIHVTAPDTPRLLWAMEEGLRCSGLSAVIGEAWGEHARLDFTATRRLAFASEAHGVACWLMRLGAQRANLSGARWRWRVESLPSQVNALDPQAPGSSRLTADLFRVRGRAPGIWEWRDEDAHVAAQAEAGSPPDRVDRAAAPVARAVGETVRRASG